MSVSATSPTEVISLFAEAMRDGRLADAVSLYEPDAVFYPTPQAEPIAGIAGIQQALEQFAALRPSMTGTIARVTCAGHIATVHNDWSLTGTAPDGSPVTMSAMSVDVMRQRADGSWGILIDDPWGVTQPPANNPADA